MRGCDELYISNKELLDYIGTKFLLVRIIILYCSGIVSQIWRMLSDNWNHKLQDKQDLDKEDARKLLEIAENEEKKVQEKMRKVNGGKKRKKDW